MLNEFFDKVYVINLADAEDRLEDFTKEAVRTGIEFTRVEAIPGSDESVVMNGIEGEGWNRNAAALAKTTLNIIKDAKLKGYKKIFIFEDDSFMISHNFQTIFKKAIKGLPEDFDFFHLNIFNEYPSKWVSPCLEKLKGAWCCQAYGINETAYDEYIARLEKFDQPIDSVTLHMHKEREKSYATRPPLVYHKSNRYSTLREEVVQY